ncbi:MAG: GGDEF domain-containing protein [Candidatus Omnitrophica bacterium]|nr:GGDEF domain-containing protein [Candidatus Omnitrophota bacterium]
MHNLKNHNVLRILVSLLLICLAGFLFLQSKNWQIRVLVSALLVLGTAGCVYACSLMEGLVISIGFIYLFILLSLYAYWLHSRRLEYIHPIFFILSAYLVTNLYKYLSLAVKDLKLKNKAITDSLTGLFTQRYFELKLEAVFNRALRKKLYLSVIVIGASSQLEATAGIIRKLSRRSDVIARHDKEGFCALLLGDKEKGALIYAEKLRKAIESSLKINLNFGIAVFPDSQATSSQDLMRYAESALEKSRESGGLYVYRHS